MNIAPLLLLAAISATDIRIVGRPDTAVKLAARDCETVLAQDPEAQLWYVWIRDSEDKELIEVYDYVLNTTLSRADYPLKTAKVYGGKAGVLLRVDLRHWLPELHHKFNFTRIIEGYVDPSFYLSQGTHKVEIFTDPYTHNGHQVNSVIFTVPNIYFSPNITTHAAEDALKLQKLTNLTVPIVEAERWLVDSLRVLDGGLYYKLTGADSYVGNQKKRLNQQEWLAQYGVDEKESTKLGGEEFVGMWRSGVLGKKARRAKFLYGTGVRPSVGPPLTVITQDTFNESKNTTQHAIYSLLDFDYDATEILATRPNGAIAYSLFNAEGVLQDSAPGNLVEDHTVPEPHTNELEPAISCIRCHAPEDQWKPMPNEVKQLLSQTVNGKRVKVLTDFGSGLPPEEVEHKLRSLYSGDLTLPLRLARDAHESAVIKMTDLKLEGDGYASTAAKIVSDRYNQYFYDAVDMKEALRTFGVICPDERVSEIFNKLLPVGGLVDPAVESLRIGIEINRADWERVYQPALSTALTNGKIKK